MGVCPRPLRFFYPTFEDLIMKIASLLAVAAVAALAVVSAFAAASPELVAAAVNLLQPDAAEPMSYAMAMGAVGMAPNQPLPEVIRVRALKGFRASIGGEFGVVNPGDVVEIPRVLAMEMRAAGKAVMTEDNLKRQKDYLPERKKEGKSADPVSKQLGLLTEAVAKLTQLVGGLVPPAKA